MGRQYSKFYLDSAQRHLSKCLFPYFNLYTFYIKWQCNSNYYDK